MNASRAAFNDIRRDQLGEILEPEAGCFNLAMPELPRLDNLVWFPVEPRHNANWVFDAHTRRRSIDARFEEPNSFPLLNLLRVKPASP